MGSGDQLSAGGRIQRGETLTAAVVDLLRGDARKNRHRVLLGAMAFEMSLDLTDSLTWAELVAFVDAARSSVNESDVVDIVTRENETDWIPDRLGVELSNAPSSVSVFSAGAAAYYRQAIQQILNEEGDARGQMVKLEELRDAFSE